MLEIANRLGVGFTVKEVQFISRAEAAQWIRNHQANKRNVSPQEAKILRGREYNAAKPDASENLKKGNKSPSGQNVRPGKPKALTSRELAKKHGVNEKTIRRDAVRVELHDAVKEADPKARTILLQSKFRNERWLTVQRRSKGLASSLLNALAVIRHDFTRLAFGWCENIIPAFY